MFKKINEDGTVTLTPVTKSMFPTGQLIDKDNVIILSIVDVETTGVDKKAHELIEVGVVKVAIDKQTYKLVSIIDEFNQLVTPTKPITPIIEMFTGISNSELLANGSALDTKRLHDLFSSSNYVLAHNASFDKGFLSKYDISLANYNWICSYRMIDWLNTYGFPSSKLELLEHYHNFYLKDSHRAIHDCYGLLAVLAFEKDDGNNYFKDLLSYVETYKDAFKLIAYVPYDLRHLVKDRGYTWNSNLKKWETIVISIHDELVWLQENIYGDREPVVSVSKVSISDLVTK